MGFPGKRRLDDAACGPGHGLRLVGGQEQLVHGCRKLRGIVAHNRMSRTGQVQGAKACGDNTHGSSEAMASSTLF